MKHPVEQPVTSDIKKQWVHWLVLSYLLFFTVVALLAPVLPLGFSPNAINLDHIYQAPFQWHLYNAREPFHWLGTDHLGRDLLANVIFGARTALFISFPAMMVATFIGLLAGSFAGYFRDTGLKISRAAVVMLLPLLLAVYFYGFYADWHFLVPDFYSKILIKAMSVFVLLILFLLFVKLLKRTGWLRKKIAIPLDFMVLRSVELTQTLPRLLLVLCLAAFLPRSLSTVILVLIISYWPAIARITRAEIIKQKSLPYLEASLALGYTHRRILLRHALPNALTPVLVAFAFGISNLMALESTLSFLGIGIPPETPSWGGFIADIRKDNSAWWLVFFPGLVLTITVLSFQTLSSFMIKLINPKRS